MPRRRTFITGALLLTTGLRAHAQGATVHRIGILLNGSPGPASDALLRNLAADFAQLGYTEGRDIQIEPRFAMGAVDRLPDMAAELAGIGFDVIIALGGPAARAAQQATDRIPVVFSIVTDPVALGLVASVERPGRNVTGVTSLDPRQASQQFELLKAVFPSLQRAGILSDHTIPGADAEGLAPIDRANVEAALAVGLQPRVVKMVRPTAEHPEPDIQAAFTKMTAEGAEAVVVLELPVAFAHRDRIAEVATAHRLPSMFPGGMGNAAGLITYGTSIENTWRRIPAMVDRILKGTNPAEIPVEFETKKELVFNLRTAGELGVTIPSGLLAQADEVIL